MTVTAPPRPPQPHDPLELQEIEDLEALIEEARQRTRRRRRRYAAAAIMLAVIGVSLGIVLGRSGPSQSASAGLPSSAGAPDPNEAASIVAQYGARSVGYVIVYADGRVILYGGFGGPASHPAPISERRLTPAGLDLVRSGAVQPSDFVLSVSLPAGAWADAEFKPYAPSGYAVSFSTDLPTPALPAAAQTMLRGKERTQDSLVAGVNDFCTPFPFSVEDRLRYFVLSSQEASVLRETLRDGGWLVGPNGRDGGWQIRPPGEPTAETQASSRPYISVMWQEPILPQGGYVPWCGGGPF